MTAIRFRQRQDHHYTVSFPYDPDIVTLIKLIVPGYARSWTPEIKEWRVSDAWADDLAEQLRRHGHSVTGLGPAPGAKASTADWAAVLFERVGAERTEAVFRALTKVLHPDNAITGDTTLQRELNDARDRR